MRQLSRRQLAIFLAERLLSDKLTKKTVYATAAYLLETKQTQQIDLLINDVAYELQQHGSIEANVTSARPLTEQKHFTGEDVAEQPQGQ